MEACGVDLLYIHNLGVWQLAKEQNRTVPLWADMSLNIYNTQNLQFWKEAGAVGATVSVELNMGQLAHLAKVSPLPLECLVQGPIEMMVSEYCAGGSFLGNLDKGACTFQCKEDIYLQDRKDAKFRLAGDQFCRMHVLNSQDLSGSPGYVSTDGPMNRISCGIWYKDLKRPWPYRERRWKICREPRGVIITGASCESKNRLISVSLTDRPCGRKCCRAFSFSAFLLAAYVLQ